MKWKRIELIFQNFTYKCTVICLTIMAGNIYMLFTGWEVRIEKYFVEVSKTAEAEGRVTFLRPRQNIFLFGPT